MTNKQKGNWEILSDMIRTSARSKGALIRFCPINDSPVAMIHFPSLKAASCFHGAFSAFAHASKETVRNVRRNKSLKKNHK